MVEEKASEEYKNNHLCKLPRTSNKETSKMLVEAIGVLQKAKAI